MKPENLQKAINDILQDYERDVLKTYGDVGKEISTEAVNKLKTTSPVGYTKKYAKSWAVKEEKGVSGTPTFTIYNKKHYRLTHLLEYGHVVRNGTGRTVGRAGAYPHIKPIEEWVQNELPKVLEQKLGGK